MGGYLMHIRNFVVEVRDKDLVRLGQIALGDLNILIEDQFNNVGSWTLTLRSDHPLAPALRTPGSGIIVTASDGTVIMSGPTVKPENAATVDNPGGTLTVNGLTDTVLLADRIAFPDPTNVDPTTQTLSHDVRTGPIETLMHAYVNANLGPDAPAERRNPHLQMGTNLGRGDVVTKRARFPVLGNLLSEMAAPAGLGFRIIQVGDHLEFQTYAVVDRTDGVRLDIQNNMLAGHRVAIAPPGATHVIVAGQGELVDRQFTLVYTIDSLAAAEMWGRRIERFVDQRQTDDPDEQARAGLEVLADEGFSQFSAQVVPMEDFAIEYGHDWFLGDSIVVVVEGEEMVSVVTGYVLRNDKDGFRMGAILGDPRASGVAARLSKVEVRVDALERGVEAVTNVGPRLVTLEATTAGLVEDLSDLSDAVDVGFDNAADDLADLSSTVTTGLAGKANTSHTHAGADITSGTVSISRIPTGATGTTVALGNHTHSLFSRKGCTLLRDSAQTLPDASLTTISWDTQVADTNSLWSSGSTVTIPSSELWEITLTTFSGAVAVGRSFCSIVFDDGTFARSSWVPGEQICTVTAHRPLSSGSTFTCEIYSDMASASNFTARLDCYRVGL